MRKDMTPRQEEIYNFIREQIMIHRLPPTIREIQTHMGFSSSNGVRCHLHALQRKGWIWLPHNQKSRNIKLTT